MMLLSALFDLLMILSLFLLSLSPSPSWSSLPSSSLPLLPAPPCPDSSETRGRSDDRSDSRCEMVPLPLIPSPVSLSTPLSLNGGVESERAPSEPEAAVASLESPPRSCTR